MKVFVVADGYVTTNDKTIQFIEESFKEVGIPTDDIEYIDSYPYEFKGTPNLKDKGEAEAWQTWNTDLVTYVQEENPDLVIAFGNNAIFALGLVKQPKGVNSVRGKPMEAHGVATLATISPNLVLREPMHQTDFLADLSVAVNGVRQIKMHIIDIESAADIRKMFDQVKITGTVAYDWEATDKDPAKLTTIPVTCAFATDQRIGDAEVVYFLQLYDKLVPCFDEGEMLAIKEALTEFFVEAGNEFDMIGHNMGYDDWVTEEYLGCRIFGCTYDTMIEKWSYNNIRPHGLKETVARYLGIPEYDKGITEETKVIKARRGKNLVHEDDFYVLKWLGIEPVTTVKHYKKAASKTTYKWPEEIDKGFAVYAMLDKEVLREYNCRDAVVTLWLHKFLHPRILSEGLEESCSFRHVVAKELLRAEQRGLPLNTTTNRQFNEDLKQYEVECFNNLVASFQHLADEAPIKKTIPSIDEFNPNSYPQVAAILFGDIGKVPIINRKALYRNLQREEVDKIVDEIEEIVYGDYADVKQFLTNGEFDYTLAEEYLDEEYRRLTKDYNTELRFEDKLLGLGGLKYNPVSVSQKTGLPGAGKVSLLMMQHQHESDFISLLLMHRKVTKLRTTFIEKLYKTRDHNDIARTHYNVVGTDSARISSSGNYNGQNFPKYIRGQLMARPGYWILSCDLKAVEVRVLAAYCQDPGLLAAIYAEDTHKAVASIIFAVPVDQVTDDQRKAGKITVFLTLYGGGAEKLSKFLGVTVSKAQQIIADFRARFPLLDEFIKKQHESAATAPHYVYTPWGTRRSVRNILSDDREVSAKFERISVNCVDEETEILSERGWIQHTDLVVGDRVLTKNIETGILEWQPVLEKFVYPDYEGDVYHMNHKSFSAVCTPNHRWIVFNKHSKEDEFRTTEDLSVWGDYRIHRTGIYEQNPENIVWTDDEVRLLGWLLTDGGYKDRCRTISLYQSKPNNIQPIMDLLDRMGFSYRHTIRDTSDNPLANHTDMHIWSICNEYCDRVRKYAPNRGLTPELVLSLTTEQRELLLETMLLGDGTHDKKMSPNDQGKRSCVFKNEDAADNFQFLLTLLGYSSNKFFTKYRTVKKNGSLGFWKVNIHRRDKTQVVGSQIEVRNEKRLMWCPNVKNGSFMARRRGQVYCTGNSPIQGGAGELCLFYEAEYMAEARDRGWADFYSDDGLINFVITVHDEITFEIHESLIWRENERTVIDAKGKEVVVYDIAGPAWELFKEVTKRTVPYPPLNTVRFDFDAELMKCWAGEPNLKKALESSSNPEEKFMWELMKAGVQLSIPDKELRDEIKDEFAEFVAPEDE